jgi:hypothetical protein
MVREIRTKPADTIVPEFVYVYIINPSRLEYAANQLLVDLKVRLPGCTASTTTHSRIQVADPIDPVVVFAIVILFGVTNREWRPEEQQPEPQAQGETAGRDCPTDTRSRFAPFMYPFTFAGF